MTNTTVHFLASYYNMTIHTYKKRDYMLEVNPKYVDGSYDDYLNVIDARWVDVVTGLFIDITAVRPHPKRRNVMCSKDKHEEMVGVLRFSLPPFLCTDSDVCQFQDLFPLRDSLFEDQLVKIPYAYSKLLTLEYGKASLTRTRYFG